MRGVTACWLASAVLMSTAARPAMGGQAVHWVEARSAHFVVLTDAGEKRARAVASQFERMHTVFHALLPAQGDENEPPITVVAVRDRRGMEQLEPTRYLGSDQIDLSGFFLRGADTNYILVRLDAQEEHAYANVYHEYTHYILRKEDGWLPLWLNEGLAQFYENTDIDEKTVLLGQANGEELKFLGRNDLLPIATLLTVDKASPYYHDELKGSTFYAESWALTHFLIASDRMEKTHRMHDYAVRLAQGEDVVTAAREAFGDLDKLEQDLSEYVMHRKFMYFEMPTPAQDGVVEVQQVATAEADAVRAGVLIYTKRAWDAQAMLEEALREDPNNALAHETMGTLLYQAGDVAGAKKWFGEAAKLDGQNYLAQYYYAVAAVQSGAKGEDDAIEKSLRAAVALNPRFAPAYDRLAMFYATRFRDLDEAQQLSAKAVELDPGWLSYRLNRAEVLLAQAQVKDALQVLHDAMGVAKSQQDVATVEARIARIEQYLPGAGVAKDGDR